MMRKSLYFTDNQNTKEIKQQNRVILDNGICNIK